MAVFTIASGQTLRMDLMEIQATSAYRSVWGLADGRVKFFVDSYVVQTVTMEAISTAPVFVPPFSDPPDDHQVNSSYFGDIVVDLQFFGPTYSGGIVGTLTGQVWNGATLTETITYEANGPDLTPVDWLYVFSFAEPFLFGDDDTVTLGAGDDVFYDYDGSLTASLGAGNDEAHLYSPVQFDTDVKWLDAGDGHDQVYYQSGQGTILGGAGNDSIGGEGNNDGNWTLNGGTGQDVIYAFKGSRIIDNRGSGNDSYYGAYDLRVGMDAVVVSYSTGTLGVTVDLSSNTVSGGGHGVDTLASINRVEGSRGADLMLGTQYNFGNGVVFGVWLWGHLGNDDITGGTRADYLYGGGDDDILRGLGGDDFIYGGTGNDRILGGAGADVLRGDAGADDFVYQSLTDSTYALAGRDRIYGFEDGVDDIDFSAFGPLSFIGTAAFSAAGQIRYEQVGSSTMVTVNTVGSSGAELRVDLVGSHVLTAADFI